MDDPLEAVAARLAIGEQPSEELPMLAAEALARGLDSPALRAAAGVPRRDVRDARDRFEEALAELCIDIPTLDEALWTMVRRTAAGIVANEIGAYDGAAWIWRQASHRVEDEGDLRVFIGLASEWQDHPAHRAEIELHIIEEAKVLLERPLPRRWVKLQAEAGCWPLWQYPGRNLNSQELPISDSVHAELSTWAKDFDTTVSAWQPGPGGFESQRDAQKFAARAPPESPPQCPAGERARYSARPRR